MTLTWWADNASYLAWIGGAFIALGLLMPWIIKRRPRQRHCPKCWYDLSHTPGLRCSECGFIATHEQDLYGSCKSRRFRILVWLGGFLLVGSYAAHCAPQVRDRGAVAAIPTMGIVVSLPLLRPDIHRVSRILANPAGNTDSPSISDRLYVEFVAARYDKLNAFEQRILSRIIKHWIGDEDANEWPTERDRFFGFTPWANDREPLCFRAPSYLRSGSAHFCSRRGLVRAVHDQPVVLCISIRPGDSRLRRTIGIPKDPKFATWVVQPGSERRFHFVEIAPPFSIDEPIETRYRILHQELRTCAPEDHKRWVTLRQQDQYLTIEPILPDEAVRFVHLENNGAIAALLQPMLTIGFRPGGGYDLVLSRPADLKISEQPDANLKIPEQLEGLEFAARLDILHDGSPIATGSMFAHAVTVPEGGPFHVSSLQLDSIDQRLYQMDSSSSFELRIRSCQELALLHASRAETVPVDVWEGEMIVPLFIRRVRY